MSEKYTGRYAGKYAEIIDLPHYQSSRRPAMSNYDRAAQFSPFAALTGYEAAVAEAGRLTDERLELSEERANLLNRRLDFIKEHISEQPEASITYFQSYEHKGGGSYITVSGRVKKIAEQERKLILTSKEEISLEDIFDIDIEIEFRDMLHTPGNDE